MLSMVASSEAQDTGLLYADVSRAYFYAKAVRPVYVRLPEEDTEPGDEGKCGRLRMSMYGTRDAALKWSLEYAATLRAAGYEQGRANPCLFYNEGGAPLWGNYNINHEHTECEPSHTTSSPFRTAGCSSLRVRCCRPAHPGGG